LAAERAAAKHAPRNTATAMILAVVFIEILTFSEWF
jgi:hypothetical protein